MNVNFLFDVAPLPVTFGILAALIVIILICAAVLLGAFVFLLKRIKRRKVNNEK